MATATLVQDDSPYKDEAEYVIAQTQSVGVILMVFDGNRGTGVTCLIDEAIPKLAQLKLQLEVVTAVRDALEKAIKGTVTQ